MTFPELQTITTPDSGKNIIVAGSSFTEVAGVGPLLEAYFSDGQFELSNAEQIVDSTENEITLSGLLGNGFLGLKALDGKEINLTAVFYLLDEIAEATITLEFTDAWPFPEALATDDFQQIKEALQIDIAKKLSFPIHHIVLDSETLSFTIGIEPKKQINFNEIPQYIQGVAVASQFPSEGFPSFQQALSFNYFEVSARVKPVILTYISAGVELQNKQENWKPFDDLIEFKNLKLDFLLMNPLAESKASVQIEATAHIAEKDIIGVISLPSLSFNCRLAPNNSIRIEELMDGMGIAELPMSEVICDEFEVVGEPEDSTFELFLGFSTEITMDLTVSTLTIKELKGHFTLITEPERQIGADLFGNVKIGSTSFDLSATSTPGEPGWQFIGGLSADSTIDFGTLVADMGSAFGLVENRPEVLSDKLVLSNLQIAFHTQTKDFHFLCETEISLDPEADPETSTKKAKLLLSIDIVKRTDGFSKTFSGLLTIGENKVSVVFEKESNRSSLLAAFENQVGQEINLVNDIVVPISGSVDLDLPDDELGLTTLEIFLLEFRYIKDGSTTTYGIRGDLGWAPKLGLSSDPNETLKIRALVDLEKQKEKKVLGTICGQIDSPIDGLEFLSLAACYNIKESGSALALQMKIGQVTFQATYEKTDNDVDLAFSMLLEQPLTFGDIATFFASLVDPSIDEYEFDPPWDALAGIDLAPIISSINLIVGIKKNPSTKRSETTVSVEFTNLNALLPSAMKTFLSITSLRFGYEGEPKGGSGSRKSKKSLKVKIVGTFLGKPNTTLEWDPVNGSAPEVPGQGAAVFDLRYLGMGQRVALTQASNVASIGEVMELLRGAIDENQAKLIEDRSLTQQNPLTTFGDGGPVAFSPESEWLIGLDVSLLKTLDLKVIFNDPVIYGLRIELSGKTAKNFAGLKFEILYQKITDDIGKYHIDLTLPDFVRHFTVGAVSVTLPLIVVDIFTNGDFKVDLGFPWNFNYSRSFAIEVFPFTGAGGFYFNKLSAATATSTPAVITASDGQPVGVFTPVYEFGLGLKIGLGKTFNYGPLKAEISITVQGIVEGVISWFNPRNGDEREFYYAIRGGIAIVGRLYGEVDFVVISVSVEVVARASIQFVVESYKDILIKLAAEVSVKAKAKVLFVTVEFEFGLKVEQSFTIKGPQHGQLPPWQNPASATRGLRPRSLTRSVGPRFAWDWDIDALLEEDEVISKKDLDLFFQPGYTWVNDGTIPHKDRVKGEALLFLENAIGEDREDFATLGKELFRWTCKAGGNSTTKISFDEVSTLYDEFVHNSEDLFTYDQLHKFLFTYFDFIVQARDAGELKATIFPMFPEMKLILGDDEKKPFADLDYQLTEKQLKDLKAYFARLKVQFVPASDVGSQAASITAGSDGATNLTPIVEFIFADYAKIIIRASLQAAKDLIDEKIEEEKADKLVEDKALKEEGKKPAQTVEEFLEEKRKAQIVIEDLLDAVDFKSIANMASRFLMHGLCLPPIDADGESAAKEPQALYVATGQQFKFEEARSGPEFKVGLKWSKTDLDGVKLQEESAEATEDSENAEEATTDLEFVYTLKDVFDASESRFALLNTLKVLEGMKESDIPIISAKPKLIKYYEEDGEADQINFALRKGVKWGTRMLIDFPKSLKAYLAREIVNPDFELNTVTINGERPQIDPSKKEAVSGFTLGTRIDLNIKRILKADEEGFLAETYLLLGTSEEEKDLLEDISEHLSASSPAVSIKMVFASEGGDIESGIDEFELRKVAEGSTISDEISIVKANLSTLNADATSVFSAKMSEKASFMQLIWEASSTSAGGYFLNVPYKEGKADELNAKLFPKGDTGHVAMIIEFPGTSSSPQFQVEDFNTCLVLNEQIDLEEKLLLAQSAEKIPVLKIPAGHIGFDLNRPVATDVFTDIKLKKEAILRKTPEDEGIKITDIAKDTTVDAINVQNGYLCINSGTEAAPEYGWIKVDAEVFDMPSLARNELDTLYQLMGYKITEHPLQENGTEGLPIGPTGEDEWLYERVIPTFNALLPDVGGLPAPGRNPYLGINEKSKVKVDAWWQDLYGNKLDLSSKTGNETFDIAYTDPVIGVNQWPSVSESYHFEKKTDKVTTLVVEFAFDASTYEAESHNTEESREKAVNAALARYEQIYFQLKQTDVAIQVQTTLLSASPSTGQQLTKVKEAGKTYPSGFVDVLSFVESCYKYLKDAQGKIKLQEDPSFSVPVFRESIDISFKNASRLLVQPEFIFSLQVFVEISRQLEFVHTSLKNGSKIKEDYEDVLKSIDYLSPKQADTSDGPELVKVSGNSLQQIVDANTGPSYTIGDLLKANSLKEGLIEDNLLIDPTELLSIEEAQNLNIEGWELFFEAEETITIGTNTDSTFESLRLGFENELNTLRLAKIEDAQDALPGEISGLEATQQSVLEELLEVQKAEKIGLEVAQAGEVSQLEISQADALVALAETQAEELSTVDPGDVAALRELKKNQAAALQEMKKEHAEAKTSLNRQHQEALAAKEKEHVLAVNQLKTEDQVALKDLRRNHTLELKQLQQRIGFSIDMLAAALAEETDVLKPDADLQVPRPSNLRKFAAEFEEAIPGLFLAVSEDRKNKNQPPDETRPLFVVQIGTEGLQYDIKEQLPTFFAIPPMANTLLSGKVQIDGETEERQFDSIDINVLARDFLVAMEDFLEPDSLIPAHKISGTDAENIIEQKSTIANSLSKLVEPVLDKDRIKEKDPLKTQKEDKLEQAQLAIKQQMLTNLVDGYDVETIVQFEVAITVPPRLRAGKGKGPKSNLASRIVGKAKVLKILQGEDPNNLVEVDPREFDFSLSVGKIPLKQVSGTSYFTYLFDTKTPEKYANLYMELEFQSAGIEYAIENESGVFKYEASNWLSLVRPDHLKQSMGQSAIPIPLRDFPMPPSLIFQRAEPDPSSRELLTDVRQWKYTVLFEHPDVAQDRVDCMVKLNVPPISTNGTSDGTVQVGTAQDGLFRALVNFSQVYPNLAKDLGLFRENDVLSNTAKRDPASAALTIFKALAKEVADAWKIWAIPDLTATHEPAVGDLHFEISEEPLGDLKQGFIATRQTIPPAPAFGPVGPDPILELPGHKEFIPPVDVSEIKTFTYEEDPEDLTFFGDSAIPDRKFMIENLDLIPQQNAWASIWLSRNKGLLKNKDNTDIPTNPSFIFQTAAVRFTNMVTPIIINDEPWDIATIDSTDGRPVKRTLLEHVQKMFDTLFPVVEGQKYEVRISCKYAFSLALGRGLNEDIAPGLPVLLGLRLSSKDPDSFADYPAKLQTELEGWLQTNKPSRDRASFIFSVQMYSKLDEDSNTSLPMLRIEHLGLKLEDIEE